MRHGATGRDTDSLLRVASPSTLRDAWLVLDYAADSTEWAVAISRALAAAPEGDAPWLGRVERERRLGVGLMYRGHLREAVKILFRNPESLPIHLIEAALLSPTLPDTADRVFRRLLAGDQVVALAATLPYWLARRDSAALREIAHRADSTVRAASSEVDRDIAAHTAQAAPAYLALLRHDTSEAVKRLEALPDSLCALCYFDLMTLGHLLAARQEDRAAAPLLDRWLVQLAMPSNVLWTLERGRVAERMRDREKAIHSYQYVADIWQHADAELQPYVTEAREGLRRMTSEAPR
jgi:hypothetical protein